MVLWYVLFYLLTMSSNYTLFDIEVRYLQILFFKVLIHLSAATDFPSLCVAYTSISFFPSHDFIHLLKNSLPLSTHILFDLRLDSYKIFWKALVIAIRFYISKGLETYLAFWLEKKMKAERSKWFQFKTSRILFFLVCFKRNYAKIVPNLFDPLEK